MSAAPKKLYLVDASIYVFRAWHSMPNEFTDHEGWPTNAVQGFLRFLMDLLQYEKPQNIVIAFDEALDRCFRNEIYPLYKANREAAPEDLLRQFTYCRSLCESLGLATLSDHRYEADDLIGTALVQMRGQGFSGVIVSADKDLSQLLVAGDVQWDFARNSRWGVDGVFDKHGVKAHQVADYLALCGDAVDNIPGVPGIGQKTAAHLLNHFASLDELLARVDEVPYLSIRGAKSIGAKLVEHAELARLFRQLTVIACDAPIGDASHYFVRQNANASGLSELADQLKLGPISRRRLANVAGVELSH